MYKQEVINFYNARTNYDTDTTRNRAIALFEELIYYVVARKP